MFGFTLALVALHSAIAAYGYSAVKLGLQSSPPMLFTAFRMGIGSLILLTAALVLGRRMWRGLPWGHIMAFSGMAAASSVTWVYGLTYIKPGASAVFSHTAPFMIAVLAAMLLGERLTIVRILGLVVGFAGTILFAGAGISAIQGFGPGVLLTLLSAFIWSAYSVYYKRFLQGVPVLPAAFMQLAVSTVVTGIIGLVAEPVSGIHWTGSFWFAVFYLAVVAGAFNLLLWLVLLKRLEATTLGAFSFLTPFIALLFGVLFFNERLTLVQGVGAALVGIGIFAVAHRSAEPMPTTWRKWVKRAVLALAPRAARSRH